MATKAYSYGKRGLLTLACLSAVVAPLQVGDTHHLMHNAERDLLIWQMIAKYEKKEPMNTFGYLNAVAPPQVGDTHHLVQLVLVLLVAVADVCVCVCVYIYI